MKNLKSPKYQPLKLAQKQKGINKKILKIKPEINIKSVIGKDEDEKIKEKNCYTSNKLYIN